ncbi:hypothetical protein Y032_0531g3032 [Ancylostoma ceylanicum]|uniref:Uncharacterized protein n=1 Tax=Ancylostoma ceylanicum TaxID=53326 RepID=A0A016WS38_9BILA|nr:hypothetical protein Y032_0531g3032 [Ancylostoma ceylanicum]
MLHGIQLDPINYLICPCSNRIVTQCYFHVFKVLCNNLDGCKKVSKRIHSDNRNRNTMEMSDNRQKWESATIALG